MQVPSASTNITGEVLIHHFYLSTNAFCELNASILLLPPSFSQRANKNLLFDFSFPVKNNCTELILVFIFNQ